MQFLFCNFGTKLGFADLKLVYTGNNGHKMSEKMEQ